DPARQPPETPSRPSCDNAFRALHRGAPRDENCPAYHAHYHRRVAEGKSKCGPARRTSVIPKGAVRCRPGRGAEGSCPRGGGLGIIMATIPAGCISQAWPERMIWLQWILIVAYWVQIGRAHV